MKALSWIAAPLWPLQLVSGQKSFRANPLLGSPGLNRRGLHLARVRLAEKMAESRRKRLSARIDPALKARYEANGYSGQSGAAIQESAFTGKPPLRFVPSENSRRNIWWAHKDSNLGPAD